MKNASHKVLTILKTQRSMKSSEFSISYPRTGFPCPLHCLACDVPPGDTDCPAVAAAARSTSTTSRFLSGGWAGQGWRLLSHRGSPSSELASMFQTLKDTENWKTDSCRAETCTRTSSSFLPFSRTGIFKTITSVTLPVIYYIPSILTYLLW